MKTGGTMENGTRRDRVFGCLFCGAAGDALGYPVEFDDLEQIRLSYGESGIREYVRIDGVAQVSDDTQMTVFTADGLIAARNDAVCQDDIKAHCEYLLKAYRQWASMQVEDYPLTDFENPSKLAQVRELYEVRDPGRTCILSLLRDETGTVSSPANDSKGCGGVMRVAPVGLYMHPGARMEDVIYLAAEAAAITHGHPYGYLTAAVFAGMVYQLVNSYAEEIKLALFRALKTCAVVFAESEYMTSLSEKLKEAADLTKENIPEKDAISRLGEGWVAEEALAIAVYCAIKHPDDPAQALCSAVNHSGDSDSTGAITGNLVGARCGYAALPENLLRGLELSEVLRELAEEFA